MNVSNSLAHLFTSKRKCIRESVALQFQLARSTFASQLKFFLRLTAQMRSQNRSVCSSNSPNNSFVLQLAFPHGTFASQLKFLCGIFRFAARILARNFASTLKFARRFFASASPLRASSEQLHHLLSLHWCKYGQTSKRFATLNTASSKFSLRLIWLRPTPRSAQYGFAAVFVTLNTASLKTAAPRFSLRWIWLRRNFHCAQYGFAKVQQRNPIQVSPWIARQQQQHLSIAERNRRRHRERSRRTNRL